MFYILYDYLKFFFTSFELLDWFLQYKFIKKMLFWPLSSNRLHYRTVECLDTFWWALIIPQQLSFSVEILKTCHTWKNLATMPWPYHDNGMLTMFLALVAMTNNLISMFCMIHVIIKVGSSCFPFLNKNSEYKSFCRKFLSNLISWSFLWQSWFTSD